HHTYYFEQPVHGHIQHFRLGFGVPGLVYVWAAVWLFFVVVLVRMLMRAKTQTRPSTTPKGGPATQLGKSGVTGRPPSVS
ncbi:MAG: hypothetical protein NT154_04935, partial [Verrucomicrobia bacterium]|nr:hypothetical protein [Verrucomicrobiota bacterium]